MSANYQDMIALAQRAAKAYYDGESQIITDDEYDALLDEIDSYESGHPDERVDHGLRRAVAAGSSSGGEIKHTVPMLSLEKVKHDQTEKIAAFLKRLSDAGETQVFVEPKFDGLALSFRYEDGTLVAAATRGDGTTGEDVTGRFVRDRKLTVEGLPSSLPGFTGEIRGEVLMSHSDFIKTNGYRTEAGKVAYAKPRNGTSGLVKAKTLEHKAVAHFVTYDIIGDVPEGLDLIRASELGMILSADLGQPFDLTHNTAADLVIDFMEQFGRDREEFDYPIDGMVIKAVTGSVRSDLGTTSREPRWALAYKFAPLVKPGVLRDIVMDVKRTGNVSFTAIFDSGEPILNEDGEVIGYKPVVLDGSEVTNASVHNPDIIRAITEDGGFPHIGDRIGVYLANDIIPQIEKGTTVRSDESEDEAWAPATEDADGFPYDDSQAIWRSTNPESNLGALLVYAASRKALDIDTFGDAVAVMLIGSKRVADLADIFTLDESIADLPYKAKPILDDGTVTEEDFDYTNPDDPRFKVERFGETRTKTLLANIAAAKEQPLSRFITALGMRVVGSTFGRRIAKEFGSFPQVLAASIDDFRVVEGVATESTGDGDRATAMARGFDRNRAVIEKLVALGICADAPEDDGAPKPLAGMTVVVTGSTKATALEKYGRNEMNDLIDSLGGRASGSVSKNTSLLVAGEGAGSKLEKAESLGVRVVTPDEFAAEVGLV